MINKSAVKRNEANYPVRKSLRIVKEKAAKASEKEQN